MTASVLITAILEFIVELVGCNVDSTDINIVVHDVLRCSCKPKEYTMIHVRMAFGRTNTQLFNCDQSAESLHVFEVWFMTAPSFTRGLFNCGVVGPVNSFQGMGRLFRPTFLTSFLA